MISVVVGTPTVPSSAWTQLVVSGGCSAAPGIGFVGRDSGEAPGTLRLFLASGDGCATTFELEAGTTPGANNIGTLTNLGQALVVPTPPPGVYYVRARSKRARRRGVVGRAANRGARLRPQSRATPARRFLQPQGHGGR